ncbi:MAG: sulfatase [Promethearchaeia archaeon]
MAPEKPNLIIFITHDQGQYVGIYDSERTPNSLNTPNIDEIGNHGIHFTNSFCTAPQCSPSRGGMQTSKYPHQNGLMGLVNRGWTLPASNKTIPMFLGENGYTTHLMGFQHEVRDVKTLGYDTFSKRGPEPQYSCQMLVDEYVRFLQKHKDDEKPFFLCIGTPEVHRPYPVFGEGVDSETIKVFPYLPDHGLVRRDIAEFYGAIQSVDQVIGKLTNALKKFGLEENTLFIYTTDHGEAFPRAKCTLYDPGIKILLLMKWPKSPLFNGGKICESLISNIDLLPTLLDLIGAEIPNDLEGKSFLPILRGEKQETRNEIYTEKTFHEIYHPIRSVRTKRYKYIKNFEKLRTLFHMPKDIYKDGSGKVMQNYYTKTSCPYEEFYDLEKDPHEKKNLINHPAYHEKIKELKQELQKWMEKTDDPLLNGKVKPQKRVLEKWGQIKLFESIYSPLESLVSFLMRNKYLHRILFTVLKHLP